MQIIQSSTLPQITPDDRMLLAQARNSLVGNELTIQIPAEVRQRLSSFLADTERYRAPATATQVEAEIAALMLSFKSARSISNDEALATSATYADILSDLPLWAIRIGFRQIKLGEVEGVSLDFPPSAPRLRRAVTDAMVPLLTDRQQISSVLSARQGLPDNPEMAERSKARVRAMYEKRSAELTEASLAAAGPKAAPFIAPTWDALSKLYQNRALPGMTLAEPDVAQPDENPGRRVAAAR